MAAPARTDERTSSRRRVGGAAARYAAFPAEVEAKQIQVRHVDPVQFVRWAGTKMADDLVSETRLSGDLLSVLREIRAYVSLQTRVRSLVTTRSKP